MPKTGRGESRGLHAWRAARQERSHKAILAATHDQFTSQGFQAASVIDIAKKAPVSTATIYKHFPSKEALVAAVIEDFFSAKPSVPHNPKCDPKEQAYAFLNAMILADARNLMGELADQDIEGQAMDVFKDWLGHSRRALDAPGARK
ncbi:regulatory protein TetR [Tepidicaulis marinus]|uniref:Regulatory protein TetR n=1 Tax=Tepidicaulis marinus TaxID=1333998 RepID=A0A081BF19_9HYPH|nr:helix-turn-helix domain-containing protein [Tepidicaulis marinus]GAK46637.1 regulatory protein TetR [Tepidicaulis marinus]